MTLICMNQSNSMIPAGGRRWVAAPKSARSDVPAVLGVYLFDGETVQWSWTHTTEGSYVSGYQIDPQQPAGLGGNISQSSSHASL